MESTSSQERHGIHNQFQYMKKSGFSIRCILQLLFHAWYTCKSNIMKMGNDNFTAWARIKDKFDQYVKTPYRSQRELLEY